MVAKEWLKCVIGCISLEIQKEDEEGCMIGAIKHPKPNL
jgi:hypothetical protein